MLTAHPEDFERLNRELTNGRRNAVLRFTGEEGQKYQVHVERNSNEPRRWPTEKDFTARVRVDGREVVEHGILPSVAINRLKVALSRSDNKRPLAAEKVNNDLPSIDRF